MDKDKKIEIKNTKAEIIGIFDENDNYIGKDTRKNMRKNNLIHRITHIVVLNPKGEIMVQTRSLSKEYCPGYLDAGIGGVVGDKEDVKLSAEREINEEIGINIDKIKDKLDFIVKYFFNEDICKCWIYCYYLKLNEEEVNSINFKDKEITSVKWLPKNELIKMFSDSSIKITEGSKKTILHFSSKNLI